MNTRIFTLREFDRFARKARIGDDLLINGIARAEQGLVYAELGQGVVKLALARPNESSRHGFRSIVAFTSGRRAFFLFGFAKNEADSVTDRALKDFRVTAAKLEILPDGEIERLISEGELREVSNPVD